MKAHSKKLTVMLLAIPVLVVALITLNGCKDSDSGSSADSGQQMQGHEGHDHSAMEMAKTEESAKAAVSTTEQTICPVMGNPINKDIYVEYQGKKVYFCCPACKPTFEKDPAKYIAKLPQFQQQAESTNQ